MAEESKSNKPWALAGWVAGGVLLVAGLCMGIFGGFSSVVWWTLGTGAVLVAAGFGFYYDIINPEVTK